MTTFSGGKPLQLPKYKSHKTVQAVKIKTLTVHAHGATITPYEDVPSFNVDIDYVNKHKPQEGGYFVQYEDGYISWSPADAFEEGYKKLEELQQPEKPFDYRDITSYELACKNQKNFIPLTIDDFQKHPEDEREAAFARHQLDMITKAVNQNKKFVYGPNTPPKWVPIFDHSSPGFGFSCSGCGDWYSVSYVGARHVFETEAQSDFVGRTFVKLFEKASAQ